MIREFDLTPFRLGVLRTLEMEPRGGTSQELGDSPPHFEAACRAMEEQGLVRFNIAARTWSITRRGSEVVS